MKEKLPYPSGKVKDLPAWVEDALHPLRSELEALDAERDEIIEAEYISAQLRGDIENVLFYNVRKDTSFRKSPRNGLRFRYLAKEPPDPPEREEHFPHYQSYQLGKKETPFLDEYENVASYEFDFAPSQKPELNDVWWGSVNAEWNLNIEWKLKLNRGEVLERFVLRVDARYPQSTGEYAVRRVKKVFDGIASAMHVWTNQKRVDEVASCVAAAYQEVSCESVRAKLQNNNHAFLGKNNKQRWDPADDKCVAGELLLSPNSKDNWRFKVEILAIE